MSKYARLTLARRVVIENMTLAGHTQIDIGLTIGVNQSTVSRDLARCGSGTYCAKRAHAHAVTRAVVPTIVPLLDRCAELVGHLSHYLTARYSIAQALILSARKYPGLATISAQAVYQALAREDLATDQPLCRSPVSQNTGKGATPSVVKDQNNS